jgi:choline transporter-like protein 2/4/5
VKWSYCRLVHGLYYKGNVCGDKRATPSLKGLGVLYWVNPSQLFLPGDKTSLLKLSNSKSIFLRDCPRIGSQNTIAWV